MRIQIIIEHDKDGYYAFAPDLPGCQSQGNTFEEADSNIREAVALYLETMEKEEIEAIKDTTNRIELGIPRGERNSLATP